MLRIFNAGVEGECPQFFPTGILGKKLSSILKFKRLFNLDNIECVT